MVLAGEGGKQLREDEGEGSAGSGAHIAPGIVFQRDP